MAYSQHEWVNGEIITAEKLNNIEQGIADCGERAIEASAQAVVEKGEGEPACDVEATGSVSSIDFKFAFKGIKGERGEAAPTISACEINIAGSVVSGKLSLSDGESVEITGTYTAGDSGGSSEVSSDNGEGEPEGGETPAEGDEGDTGGDETPAEGEADNGEGEPAGGSESEGGGGEAEPDSGEPDNGGGE